MKADKILSAFACAILASAALAHDVWVFGENSDKLRADIGFGHDFSKYEAIAENKRKYSRP